MKKDARKFRTIRQEKSGTLRVSRGRNARLSGKPRRKFRTDFVAYVGVQLKFSYESRRDYRCGGLWKTDEGGPAEAVSRFERYADHHRHSSARIRTGTAGTRQIVFISQDRPCG